MNKRRFDFGMSKLKVNTFIGGVSSYLNTPTALASKLGISASRIKFFSIVGADIQCAVIGNYSGANEAFKDDYNITYFDDRQGLVLDMAYRWFWRSANVKWLNFPKCRTVFDETFIYMNSMKVLSFPKAVSFSGTYSGLSYNPIMLILDLPEMISINYGVMDLFIYMPYLQVLNISKCTELGRSVNREHSGFNGSFDGTNLATLKIYANPYLQTCNAGGIEGDLAFAISQGTTVTWVTNFTPPNAISNLSAGTVTATTIQLNFTAPTGSTNAIDFYECFANNIYMGRVTASGQTVTGFVTGTNYNIILYARDVFYNKSISNQINVTTL